MFASTDHEGVTVEVASALRRELLRLAYAEDELATDEAAGVPYWEPCPISVQGHRVAAAALRSVAERIAT